MTNALVEDWFNEALDIDYARDDQQAPRRLADREARLHVFEAEPDGRDASCCRLTLTRIGARSIGMDD